MSFAEAIWNHDHSRIFFTLLLTVFCVYAIFMIFKHPEKFSILYKIKNLWTMLGGETQFLIIMILALMSIANFMIMFSFPGLLGKAFLAIPVLYMILVVAYALTKEIKRHQDKTLLKLPGEFIVLIWTVVVVSIDVLNFFWSTSKIPQLLEYTYYLVLTVFFITRTSKIHKLSKSGEGKPYKDGQIGWFDKITFNVQYYIGLCLGVSCLGKYVLDFVSKGRFTTTEFGVGIYLWYIATYAGEKEFRRLTRVKSKRPIGTKHGQWMVAVWLIALVLMFSVAVMTKWEYTVPRSLPLTILWIIAIYFFTIITKLAMKNGTNKVA